MSAFRAITWRYATASESVCLTASEATQGYQLPMAGPSHRERHTFHTVDGVVAAQSACERTLMAQGFLLIEFIAELRDSLTACSDH